MISTRNDLMLSDLISTILKEMEQVNYSIETIKLYRRIYDRLEKLAVQLKKDKFDEKLAQVFINDSTYAMSNKYCHSRFCLHNRCIQFITSYLKEGVIDWSTYNKTKRPELKVPDFIEALKTFNLRIKEMLLKRNTVEGYDRIVFYFLQYCEEKGYQSFVDIHCSDINLFIEELCKNRYQPTSLGALLPGLKLFLSENEFTKSLINFFPYNLQKKRDIIPVLEVDEHDKFIQYLKTGSLSNRDRAICWIALETGLRAVDICNIKICDIDWDKDTIQIAQQKTCKPFELPLRSTYGNAMADYLLYERPQSNSPFLFLSTKAPYKPLISHAGYYIVLKKAFRNAGILELGRICGTRFTRHNAASHMLRKGIPLSKISSILGHTNPNSVNIYLTTDENALTECTLPLPSSLKTGDDYE